MKIKKYWVLIIGLMLITVSVMNMFLFGNETFIHPIANTNETSDILSFSSRSQDRFDHHMGIYDNEVRDNDVKLSKEELMNHVEDILKYYQEDLVILDIIMFEDDDYYFSVIEEDTGRGGFDFLVDPFTGRVYPMFGPNMTWNLKYGMHRSGGMIGRGRMRHWNGDYETFENDNEISVDEAYNYGIDYIKSYDDFTLSSESIEFYGYYTFHVIKDDLIVGLLSVNGYTGDVWYHEWQSKVIEVITGRN